MAELKQRKPRIAIMALSLRSQYKNLALRGASEPDFTIYESADGVGGVWHVNLYPGAACDSESHWYCLSTELNPNFSKKYVGQAEILAYWRAVFKKHDLASRTRFNHRFISARWERDHYSIVIEHDGRRFTTEAEVLISCAGPLVVPQMPRIAGIDSFKGEAFHTARVPAGLSYSGKRVGIVGNACSGAQCVAALSRDDSVKSITSFARTSEWLFPPDNYFYRPSVKRAFAAVPFLIVVYRFFFACLSDIYFWAGWRMPFIRKRIERQLGDRMRSMVPERYRETIVPTFSIGCRRIIRDPGYLEALHHDNVELVRASIEKITPTGIQTVAGHHELDLILYATGFDISSAQALDVTGARGQTLGEYYRERGGAEAYRCVAVPTFPSFWQVTGPNAATGWSNAIPMIEATAGYIAKMVRLQHEYSVTSWEAKQEASDLYNAWVQHDLKLATPLTSGCSSWYVVKEGEGPPKNTSIYPATASRFIRELRTPRLEDYVQNGGQPAVVKSQSSLLSFAPSAVHGALARLF